MRGRRLDPYYHASCNGTDVPPRGCGWTRSGSNRRDVRDDAEQHAQDVGHEVVIQNTNDGLVLDGRPGHRRSKP